MIEGKWFKPGDDISQAEKIRLDVFGKGKDDLDNLSWNVAVWQDGTPCACGRIWWQEGAFWLGDIGVLPQYRHKMLGDLTLRLLLYKAQSHNAALLRLMCPDDTAPFFTRLGFEAVSTSPDGLILMEQKGSDICLDSCEKCTKDCPNRIKG